MKAFLFISAVLLVTIHSSYIEVERRKKKCIFKEFKANDTIEFSYSVLGYMRERYHIELYYNREEKVWNDKNKESGDVKLNATKDGKYYLCVRGENKRDIKVSFNFIDRHELNQAVSVDSIDNLSSAITSIAKEMKTIDFNIKKGGANRDSYAEIASSIRNRITLCTTLKIIFLLFFSFFQIHMITSVFKKVKVVKKIEMNKFAKADSTEFL